MFFAALMFLAALMFFGGGRGFSPLLVFLTEMAPFGDEIHDVL